MRRRHLGLVVVVLVGLASPGRAQDAVDVKRLGIDVARIQRQLRQTSVREERDGLNLTYTMQVFGQSPRLVLFTERDNIKNGRAPYGSPTHREMLEVMTPKPFRAPAADFSALARWLADKSKK